MKAPCITAVLLAILFCGFAVRYTSAATRVVTKTADTNDGVCDADCSLREAVAVANADDTVVFSPLFNTPQTITLTIGQIAITRNLAITGPGAEVLAVSGNNANRIFRITGPSNVSLAGMKLMNGFSPEASGGAVYVANGSVNLTGLLIINNSAGNGSFGYGGGIYMDTATLIALNSTISNNIAGVTGADDGRGGGIYSQFSTISITGTTINSNTNEGIYALGLSGRQAFVQMMDSSLSNNTGNGLRNVGSCRTTVLNSVIRNNRAGILGADSTSMLTIVRSDISYNTPGLGVANSGLASITDTSITNNVLSGFGGSGGGISNSGTMYVLNSSITNNRAFESGGGISNANGPLYLTNSTISGNRSDSIAGTKGGGIYSLWDGVNMGGVVVLTNCTVTNNYAANGGGIRQDPGGTLQIRNTIVAGNTAPSTGPDISGPAMSDGFNLIGNITGSSGWVASDLFNVDPILAPLGSNGGRTLTHPILPGSPAINSGSSDLARDPFNNSPLVCDQRGNGFARLVGTHVDIGAYEANYSMTPVPLRGRVITAVGGRGVANARVTLTNGGNVLYTQTNPFGYYQFLNLQPGTTYSIQVTHKFYQFPSPQFVTIDQSRNDLNFVAVGP